MTLHTCGGPIFGRLVPGCPRCDELASGMAPRRWSNYHARKAEQALARDVLAAPSSRPFRPSEHVCRCGHALSEHRSTGFQCPPGGAFRPDAATLARFPEQYPIPAPRPVSTDVRRVKPW